LAAGVLFPTGVAVDAVNNLWIADSSNSRFGEWTTGQGFTSPVVTIGSEVTGLAVDGSGNVWVATPTSLEECSACGTKLSAAVVVSGAFENPQNTATGLAVDSFGNVFAADIGANSVWECPVCAPGGSLVTIATPTSPRDVSVDGLGNIFVANGTLLEWSSQTQGLTTLYTPPDSGNSATAVAITDTAGDIFLANYVMPGFEYPTIVELPYAFVGPLSLTEPVTARTDSLLPVLPSTTSLTGVFAPTSDQNWLTIGPITNGVINFSFTATTSARVAHITVLGQSITVTQSAPVSVPNVVAETQAAATTVITGAGLFLGTVTMASSGRVALGSVISESPAVGTSVVLGSEVNLVVSSGISIWNPSAVPQNPLYTSNPVTLANAPQWSRWKRVDNGGCQGARTEIRRRNAPSGGPAE
jgi:hypothetical protein